MPPDKFGLEPHEKSMTIKVLATILPTSLPGWYGLNTDELDFAKKSLPGEEVTHYIRTDALFENTGEGRNALANGKMHKWPINWPMRLVPPKIGCEW